MSQSGSQSLKHSINQLINRSIDKRPHWRIWLTDRLSQRFIDWLTVINIRGNCHVPTQVSPLVRNPFLQRHLGPALVSMQKAFLPHPPFFTAHDDADAVKQQTTRLNPFARSWFYNATAVRGALWWLRKSHSVNYANHQRSPFARRRHDVSDSIFPGIVW